MPQRSVWIVSAVRTPIGSFGGSLKNHSAVDLATHSSQIAIERSSVSAQDVDVTIFGQARQAGSGPNPARQTAIRSGIPESSPAYTVNQACASGLLAVRHGMDEILHHGATTALVGGVESMSTLPYYLTGARWGYRLGSGEVVDANYKDGFFCPITNQLMGLTAETLAQDYQISREEQEAFAINTQSRAFQAREEGFFEKEIAPVPLPKNGIFSSDETIRERMNPESLSRLPTVFLPQEKGGTVTPATSSGITDGAAALILVGGTTPPAGALGRLVDWSIAGVDPARMGLGPVPACRKLEKKTGWKTVDYDHVELNEAFASQVIACQRELEIPPERINPRGGAIALGHPIGCTGARIVVTLVHALNQNGGGRGLATLCVSGGMGVSLAVETPFH
ncbi:thiolase family protein [bacterium]|nr:thiolase family protein [bacterium]